MSQPMRPLLIIAAIVVVLAGGGYWYWTTTPLFAVEQLKSGIKSHDLDKVEKYADLDSVSSNMVDDFVAQPMRGALGRHPVLGQLLVTGLVGLFKPQLADGIKDELKNFVLSGSFRKPGSEEETNDDSVSLKGISLGRMDKHLGFRKHSFRKVEYSRVEGKVAILGLDMFNATYNTDLTLEVKLQNDDGHWRLIGLTNLPEFMGKLAKLEADHPATIDSTTGAQPSGI